MARRPAQNTKIGFASNQRKAKAKGMASNNKFLMVSAESLDPGLLMLFDYFFSFKLICASLKRGQYRLMVSRIDLFDGIKR